jgi:magnesium chelatase family protein
MNPCPCGQHGVVDRICACPPGAPERYLRRVSGPLRDRIDLWVAVDRVPPALLVAAAQPEGSAPVAARIARARDRQRRRGEANGRLRGRALRAICALRPSARERVVALAEREEMSARGTDRLLRVARTIADLEGQDRVGPRHLDEAARFRAPVDRMTLGKVG